MIYFVRCDVTGLTKIGYTARPMNERLLELQCGSPTKLRVLGAREGAPLDELAAHRYHHEKRRHGEWFALTDEDIERERLRPARDIEATEEKPPPRASKPWDPARRIREAREYAARAAARGNARE